MASAEDIRHQQTLLATYRQTLAIQLNQRATLGTAYTPPGTISGILEARAQIRRIKDVLREWSVPVDDDPNDEEIPAPSMAEQLAQPQGSSSPTINITGPFHSGSTYIGGQQHIEKVQATMGDRYDLSNANISGSNLNLGSTLTNVTQSIGTIPNASTADKQQLEVLVKQLQTLLQQVPPEQAEDAEKVSTRTKAMIDEAQKTKPDKEFIDINGESLKKAAANIGAVMPAVLTIATQVVTHIMGMLK